MKAPSGVGPKLDAVPTDASHGARWGLVFKNCAALNLAQLSYVFSKVMPALTAAFAAVETPVRASQDSRS